MGQSRGKGGDGGNLFANHSSLIIIINRGKKAAEFIRDPLHILS
jgi:hypothetical protein